MSHKTLKRAALLGAGAAIASALSVGAAVAPAFAEPVVVTGTRSTDPDLPSRIVKYGDLNLMTPAGEARFLRRVGYAVSDICTSVQISLIISEDEKTCRTTAWSNARSQMASALALARNGATPALTAAIRISAQ